MNSLFPPNSHLVAYLRDSGGNRQDLSTAQQERVIREWCAENDCILTQIFADVARPGGTTIGRDQFDAMIAFFERKPKEAGVVLWSYSRLSRNFDDAQYYVAKLRRAGYEIFSLEENIPAGSVGKVVESLHFWMAEQYRHELSRNVRRGLEYVVRVHKAFPRPTPPRGYSKQPVIIGQRRNGDPHYVDRLVPNDDAPLVQEAFEMRAAGRSYGEISRKFGWYADHAGWRLMFENPVYIGELLWNNERIPNFCDPIVDVAVWQAVQDVRERWRQREVEHPRRATSDYLLSGLLRCAVCLGTMVGDGRVERNKEFRYYRCRHNHGKRSICGAGRIPARQLEADVLDAVRQFLTTPETLIESYRQARSGDTERNKIDAQIVAKTAELNAIEKRIKSVVQNLEIAQSKALALRLVELEQEQANSEDDLRLLRAQATRLPEIPDMSEVEIISLGEAVWGKIEREQFREKQLLLRQVISQIFAARSDGLPSVSITFMPIWNLREIK